MFDATSPSDPGPSGAMPFVPGGQGVSGRAELNVLRRDADDGAVAQATPGLAGTIGTLYQSHPLRLLFPRPEPGEPLTAVLVNVGGGLVGGDHLGVSVTVGADASALVVGQAAEKVYRSSGPDSRVDVRLVVGPGGWLEWLPQETIVFESARLRRAMSLEVAPGGRMMAGEMIVFGRIARGERTGTGLVRESWQVRRDGRLVWADALHLEDDYRDVLRTPACFDGALACGSVVYAGDDVADAVARAREMIGDDDGAGGADGVRSGVTRVGEVLVARWLGGDPFAVREAFGRFWSRFRHGVAGRPDRLPRLWHC